MINNRLRSPIMFKEIDGKTYFCLDIEANENLNFLLNYCEEIKSTRPEICDEINKRLNKNFLDAVSSN